MGFEHESIRRLGDRDWSERLLDALLDAGIAAAEREEIWETLREVDDPRLAARLRAALRDATLPPEIREYVLQLIFNSEENLSDAEARELWDAGDPLLRRLVLSSLRDPDVVVPHRC